MESRLVVLFPDEPSIETARERLSAFPSSSVDGEAWALAVGSVRVAPVEPPELDRALLGSARFDEEGERIAAEAARGALAVTAELAPPALASFRAQLAVAAALARGCSVVDLSAQRVLAPREVERLAASEPRARDLLMIHSVGRRGGRSWLHTHGLARAGVPDLEVLRVRDADREDAAKVIFTLADLLVSGDVPASGVVPIGESVSVALLDLDDALARIEEDEVGGETSRDDEHRGARVVVAPPRARRDGSVIELDEVCEAVRGTPVLFSSRAETERQARVARETLPRLRSLWLRREPGRVFLVKLGYEADGGRGREHLWFRVVGMEPARIEAVLESSPRDIAAMKKGSRGWHSLERISDWISIGPDGARIGPGDDDVA